MSAPSKFHGPPQRPSLVNYSKVADRQDDRTAATATAVPSAQPAATTAALPQMDAVTRMLTGRPERTIAEKLADANRPTWEQYKKDNHDKLNLDGLDQKQMEEYRRQLDADRDPRMAGLMNANRTHGKKSSSSSHRKKHGKQSSSKNEASSESDSSSSAESDSSRERRRRRRKQKRKQKEHDKKESKKKKQRERDELQTEKKRKSKKHKRNKDNNDDDNGNNESDGEHYRLSNFFASKESEDV